MKLTEKWLDKEGACSDGKDYALENLKGKTANESVAILVESEKFDWALWLIAHALDRKGRIRYAIYSAEQVLKIYEDKYPKDKRPREAINAAKKCLKADTKENRNAAYAAASYASYAAANAAMKNKIIKYGVKLLAGE
jgi:hypothetical protein